MSSLEIFDAFKQEVFATLPMQGEKEALAILDKAHQLYADRDAWLPVPQRIAILERTLELIKDKAEDLILEATEEGGKPYVDSKVEIDRGIDGIKIALKELSHLKGTEIPMGVSASSANRMAYTRREPRGVVLAISAFNHPFNLIIHQAIPAIAVGCPVIIKPAMTTPLSCRNLVTILEEAGLPEGWCQMLMCENEVAEKVLTDPRISFLTFIGSAKVGWYLRSKLPPGAGCALEHGGAAPVIFDETADIAKSIPLLVKGGFYHAGQVCVSVQRLYLHESIEGKFIDPFLEAVKKLKVGDPTEKDTDVGPLILPKEVDRVHTWVEEAVSGGGKLLCGGEKISDTCYAPTVILNPPEDCQLSTNEVFGPVVCIYTYKDRNEAIKRANSLDYGFQAAVFTKDLDVALDTAKRLEGLAIMVNDHTAFRVDWMPFGGYKQSGLGVGGIGYTMHDLTLEKMIVFNTA